MNWFVLAGVLVVLVALRWVRPGALGWLAAIWVGLFVFFRFGFAVPIPASVLKIYMGIASGALLIYAMADAERLRIDPPPARRLPHREAVHRPAGGGGGGGAGAGRVEDLPRHDGAGDAPQLRPYRPPGQPAVDQGPRHRVRPQRPGQPLPQAGEERSRRLPPARRARTARSTSATASSATATCSTAAACSPTPSTRSPPTSATRARSRSSRRRSCSGASRRGDRGCPPKGGPWATAMPAWEKFLSEDEMWDTILFLYDFTGSRPRARVEEAGK